MRTTLLAGLSALVLLATPVLAAEPSGERAAGTPPSAAERPDAGAAPGSTGPGGALSKEEIRRALESAGFTDVGDPVPMGGLYEVQAMNEGQRVTLVIDPVSHQIRVK